jgi:hypothetical protein
MAVVVVAMIKRVVTMDGVRIYVSHDFGLPKEGVMILTVYVVYFTIFPVDLGAHMAEVKTEEGVTIDMVKEEMESTVDDTVGEALEGTLARSKKLSERAVTT